MMSMITKHPMNIHNQQVNKYGIRQIDVADIALYLQLILMVYLFVARFPIAERQT